VGCEHPLTPWDITAIGYSVSGVLLFFTSQGMGWLLIVSAGSAFLQSFSVAKRRQSYLRTLGCYSRLLLMPGRLARINFTTRPIL